MAFGLNGTSIPSKYGVRDKFGDSNPMNKLPNQKKKKNH